MKERNIIKMNDKENTREFQDVVEILQEEILIPEVVMEKANQAFDAIKAEQNQRSYKETVRKSQKRSWKKICILAAAATLTLGGVTAGAAVYMKWSKGLSEGMKATEEQMIKAEESNLAAPVNQTFEVNGIKVTAVQSIVDSHFAMLSFKVDGYRNICPKGSQPLFNDMEIWVDGYNPGEEGGYDTARNFSINGKTYDGYVVGEDGMAVRASDGTTMSEARENGTYTYFMEDGSFEWQVILANEDTEGTFLDKSIHVELKDLGTIPKATFIPDVEGTWSFDWTLTGSEAREERELNAPLGDTGAKLTYVKLSPISITLTYNCTDKTTRPPRFYGIRLKDGTVWSHLLLGPGSDSSLPDENGDFFTTFALNRILDINDVEAILFFGNELADGESYEVKNIEKNCYAVPLKE